MSKLKTNFLRSQGTALIGGLTDLSIMLLLKEVAGWHYTSAIVAGGMIGAVINYTLNRYWAFDARQESKSSQVGKYAVVSLSSVILKTSGTFAMTEFLSFDYRIARLILDVVIAWGFNFTLMHYWVFKPKVSTG